MAPHSSTLAWKIPWAEDPSRLQSMGLLRVGHNWATSLSLFTFMHWRRKWQPTPVFLSGESQGWTRLSDLAAAAGKLFSISIFFLCTFLFLSLYTYLLFSSFIYYSSLFSLSLLSQAVLTCNLTPVTWNTQNP